MSIIHQALKKAAAESQVAPNRPAILKNHSAKSFFTRSRFLMVLIFVFLVSFIFSEKRIWPNLRVSFYTGNPAKEVGSSTASEPKVNSLSADRSPQVPLPLKPAPSNDKKEGETALDEGLDFYNQGKMELANKSFAKAVSLFPLSAIAHNNLGLTLRNLGKIHEAMEHYQEAIRLDSDYAEAHNNLGMAYDQLGSIDQAASYYKKAITLKPAIPEFHLNYATWLERKGDFVKARQEYQRYLSLQSNAPTNTMTDQQKDTIALVNAHLRELKGF